MPNNNMNSVQLSAILGGLCRDEVDRAILPAIMASYMQISGFYPEHAIAALKMFQKSHVLVLNVAELNRLAATR